MDNKGHLTRLSDSSLYDEVCTKCGATDAAGDKRLDLPCGWVGGVNLQVKYYRELMGITQAELARKSGLTPAAISYIELGDREPSLKTALKLAKALGCTLDEIAGNFPQMNTA